MHIALGLSFAVIGAVFVLFAKRIERVNAASFSRLIKKERGAKATAFNIWVSRILGGLLCVVGILTAGGVIQPS
ncbi:hypothetical protein WDH52_18930 [Streptomyces sp. TRM70308]|uniref:hypothetical protein n=1 Tax=Streptomyces sp. TRM70308 TaxID=3131932 RepID=UPI003D093619